MKRFGILLIAAMLGLVLACGSQEAKAPAKPAAPLEKARESRGLSPTGASGAYGDSLVSVHDLDGSGIPDRPQGRQTRHHRGRAALPRPGTDRLPAVVLLHGSGGVSGNVLDWEQDLNAMGVATFVLDSFTAARHREYQQRSVTTWADLDDRRRLSRPRCPGETPKDRSHADCPYGIFAVAVRLLSTPA